MHITKKQFNAFFDRIGKGKIPSWRAWDRAVNLILPVKRQPEFLAQCAYESCYFISVDENLKYTTTKRILAVFGKRIRDKEQAKKLLRNPEGLAEAAYRNHPHLGNNSKGAIELYKKGWKVWDFRGQGYIQITGYNNWQTFHEDTGIDCFKNKSYFMQHPWLSSAYFWKKYDIDYLPTMEDMTKKINGGINGLKERFKIYKDILKAMKTV